MNNIEVLTIARNEQLPLYQVEVEVMGIDHQEVGLMIAEKWKLNQVITGCIGSHHQGVTLSGELGQQVALVALGNMYSNIVDHGYAGDPFPAEEEVGRLLAAVDLSWQEFCGIGDRVVEEIKKARDLFKNISRSSDEGAFLGGSWFYTPARVP